MNKKYFAHSANQDGEWEPVATHLTNVSKLCSEFLSPIGCENTGKFLGALHDMGKYSDKFAGILTHDRVHVNHSYPGAAVLLNMFRGSGALLSTIVAAHHTELDSTVIDTLKRMLKGTENPYDRNGNELSLYGCQELVAAFELLKSEVPLPKKLPEIPQWSRGEDKNLSYMLAIRMLFSGLVDADYSATAAHYDKDYIKNSTGPALDPQADFQNLLDLQAKKRAGSHSASSLNNLRDALFDSCVAAASQAPGLFTLTAPTGLGKTLSLFAFASKHCEIYGKRRIIILLPFLTLAQQNIRDYIQIEPALLESNSISNLSESARLLAERWSAPCIVTTTVGFFEPLFACRPQDCRKLHQIANSVIVLDEAQALPSHLLDTTLRTVKDLCNNYGCTFVFSTATQPSFQHRPGLEWNPREIVPNPQFLFDNTRRVTYNWRIDTPSVPEDIARELADRDQVCLIVNLRRHARLFHNLLKEICDPNEVFFLTTDLCPKHRETILDEVRYRLANDLPCKLVATQCIEAGVDLDFPVVYRSLAPLESIIQAAGRCNRNGDSAAGKVIVFIPDIPGRLYPGDEYQRAANCVIKLNSRHPIDCSDLTHTDEYYSLLYPHGEGDKESLRKAISERNFKDVRKEYKIISDGGVNIIVPYDKAVFSGLRDLCDREGLTSEIIKAARPYTVSSFMSQELQKLCVPISPPKEQARQYQDEAPIQAGSYCVEDNYQSDIGLTFGDVPFSGIF